MTGASRFDPAYVAARRVLLDALEALGPHRKAVVLVGAQAIYWHIGEGDLAVAPHTTDGDLVIDPRELDDVPDLSRALTDAGFALTVTPGTWTRSDVPIDLIVPAQLGGSGRRGARLGAHGTSVARKTVGLEAAVVDHVGIRLGALENGDGRSFEVRVAGLAALLVAKLHKVFDRKDEPGRSTDKDALDVLRILRFAEPDALTSKLNALAREPVTEEVTSAAMRYLVALFGNDDTTGTRMVVRAIRGLEDETAVARSCAVLTGMLAERWARASPPSLPKR
jgi:hypothetical protein